MSANEKAEAALIVIKRLLKWLALAVLLLLAVLGSYLGYDQYEQYQRNRPRLMAEYASVKLGETRQEVLYALGEPAEVQNKGGPRKTHTNGERDALMSASSWWYLIRETPPVARVISFDESGKLDLVACFSEGYADCPAIFGLTDGSTEEDVLERLGPPDKEEVTDAVKILAYKSLQVQVYLKKRVVYGLQVYMPAK